MMHYRHHFGSFLKQVYTIAGLKARKIARDRLTGDFFDILSTHTQALPENRDSRAVSAKSQNVNKFLAP